jgi:ABC-type Zn2+ transport system substrate-binding protein/surface adhesin
MPRICKAGILLTAAALFFILFTCGSALHAETVVASTSLTAALARAAGASEVRVLTPADVKHPPEYELRPSDLTKLEGASAVVYAGYERMVQKLIDTSKGKNLIVVQVDTTTSPDNLVAQARRIAAVLHTEKKEQAWEKGFLEKLRILKENLAPYSGKKAVVHLHAQGLVPCNTLYFVFSRSMVFWRQLNGGGRHVAKISSHTDQRRA